MSNNIASLAVPIGTEHWPTPWAYIYEAGYFPVAIVHEGVVTGYKDGGDARGVNIRIPAIPALPEDWRFEPMQSKIAIIHRRARMALDEAPDVLLAALAGKQWEKKEGNEKHALLTYADAAILAGNGLDIPTPPAILNAARDEAGVYVVADESLDEATPLSDQPFLAWRVQALLVLAANDGMIKANYFPGGVIGYAPMAVRSFVEYTRDPEKPPSDNPLVTTAYITEDKTRLYDPMGRTQYHV